MTNLRELKYETDVKETLQHFIDCADKLDAVIVIALNRDGTQFLRTSRTGMWQKCYLKCFFDSWVMKWFSETSEEIR